MLPPQDMASRQADPPIDVHAPTVDAAVPTLLSSGSDDADAEQPVCVPGRLYAGQYEVRGVLGRGGMAEVYLVEHRTLRADFALKVLRRSYRKQPEIVERFRVEARALWELAHPGFVRVHHAGDDPELGPYLVLERLRGRSLADVLLATGRLEPAQAIPIGVAIADAAGAMHARGMVHRDLKPDNVFVALGSGGERSVKLLDLGAAKIAKYGAIETAANHTIGTLRYMSPEQLRAESVGPATDVYALGHILYECLAGRHAFGERGHAPTSPLDVLRWHVEATPTPLDEVAPGVGAQLAKVVARALAFEVADRYASMAELSAELRRASTGADPIEPAEPLARGAGRTQILTTGGDFEPVHASSERWLTPRGTVRLGAVALASPSSRETEPTPVSPRTPGEPSHHGARRASKAPWVVGGVLAVVVLVVVVLVVVVLVMGRSAAST
jgi:serine/threonine protein kinase